MFARKQRNNRASYYQTATDPRQHFGGRFHAPCLTGVGVELLGKVHKDDAHVIRHEPVGCDEKSHRPELPLRKELAKMAEMANPHPAGKFLVGMRRCFFDKPSHCEGDETGAGHPEDWNNRSRPTVLRLNSVELVEYLEAAVEPLPSQQHPSKNANHRQHRHEAVRETKPI